MFPVRSVFSSVQLFSHVQLFVTPWTAACQASLSITNSQCLLKLMFIESVMPSNHLILCHPLLLLPSIFPSIRVFSNESVLCIRWPKYWSFSFSIGPSNEYSGLISFRIDFLDLLAVQRTLRSLLQNDSAKTSSLWRSAFFIVQLSHPYMTTGKTIALTRWTFIGKVMSLLFNMLSRLVIAFLPRRKCLLISWLQSTSAVILEPPPQRSLPLFPLFSHLFTMKWWGQMPWSLFFEYWVLSQLFSFTWIKRLFSSSLLSAKTVVSSSCQRILMFLPAISIPACASSSLAFHVMYSAYKFNEQGDNIQPWYTPFPIWDQSVDPCPVLTIASWPAYIFIRRQVRWSDIPISLRIFHSLLWSTQ